MDSLYAMLSVDLNSSRLYELIKEGALLSMLLLLFQITSYYAQLTSPGQLLLP
jgi:hypothetical protein